MSAAKLTDSVKRTAFDVRKSVALHAECAVCALKRDLAFTDLMRRHLPPAALPAPVIHKADFLCQGNTAGARCDWSFSVLTGQSGKACYRPNLADDSETSS